MKPVINFWRCIPQNHINFLMTTLLQPWSTWWNAIVIDTHATDMHAWPSTFTQGECNHALIPICNTPSSEVHPSSQPTGKTCDGRGYYKGFNILADLKEIESTELIKQTHPHQQLHSHETCHPLRHHVPGPYWCFKPLNRKSLSCYRQDNDQQLKVTLIGLCANNCGLFSADLCQRPQDLSDFSSP